MVLATDAHKPIATPAQSYLLDRDEFGDRIYKHPSCEAVPYAASTLVYAKLLTTDEEGDNLSSVFKVRVLSSCKSQHLAQIIELAALYFPESRVVEIWVPESRSEDCF